MCASDYRLISMITEIQPVFILIRWIQAEEGENAACF